NRYYVRDLALLKTLAEQTAVALENARLVADLVQLNHVLKRANADVERANVRLQEAGQLKSDFIGMVTHELRTPFANMAFSLQLLQRTGTDNWMPAQGEALRQLAQEMQAGREMVDNLIKMATFLRKQEALRPAAFDFREVVVEGIRPLQTLAASKDICLHVNGSTGPMPVWADRDRLLDAVHHLVHNAIKFTGAGGEISVRATLEGACVRFEVRDTGVGVAPERLPALWQSFDQVADPHRRSAEGLGLGLALVKHIAVAHQGEVFAHSQVNVGSLFGFTIPAN
ncbi:MAG: HAMP domain-containing histidine kinase, partial [Anaerolineales bacterium]|nr:HAMP domain-containing histidine kinase [Anaerolineales bacterium]